METKLINVGNSKGIIIPAKILKLLGLRDKVSVAIDGNKMIIEPIDANPRADWIDRFKQSTPPEDDSLHIPDVFEDDDFDEWTW